MRARSFTLLEILIAIVLLLALGALVFPWLADSLEERAFETAADATSEQLMLARAHAQATGTPVEVRYRADTSQVQVRFFEPWLPGFDATKLTESAEPGQKRAASDLTGAAEARDQKTITESWANRVLGHGVQIVAQPPTEFRSSQSDMGKPLAREEYQTLDDLMGNQDVRLAVFMPDGSALMTAPVWITDADGRLGLLRINPWSGLPIFERLANVGDQPVSSAFDDDAEDARLDGPAASNGRSRSDRSGRTSSRDQTGGAELSHNRPPSGGADAWDDQDRSFPN